MGEKRSVLGWYLRERRTALLCFLGFGGIFALVFALYRLSLEAVLYPSLLCAAAGAVVLGLDHVRFRRRHGERMALMEDIASGLELLPAPETLGEAELSAMLRRMGELYREQSTRRRTREREAQDYFAVWVHQIKTPIAAMGMLLQQEDSPSSRALSVELLRIEQYVDMVLGYLRLREGGDYVFRETALDEVIRPVLRKFAPQFIHKRLRLAYEGTEERVLTDEKWLGFILEQLLSNAVKYTPRGTISLRVQEGVLELRDTGIGIAPEDLPRIFERGFTGYNGRADRKATGLGLYLCRQAADALEIPITVESAVGEGTVFRLRVGKEKLTVE